MKIINLFLSFIFILPSFAKGQTYPTTLKTTGKHETLLSRAFYEYYMEGYIFIDSTIYRWSGDRTSIQENNDVTAVNYDMLVSYSDTEPGHRTLQTFDIDGRIAQAVNETWYRSKLAWDTVDRIIYTYASDSIIGTRQLWNSGAKLWVNLQRWYSIFSAGNLIDKFEQGWIESTGTWQNQGTRSRYFYSGSYKTEDVTQTWGGSDWKNYERTEYSYSATDTTRIISQWESSTGWVPQNKLVFFYPSGMIDSMTVYKIDPSTKSWTNVERHFWTYSGSDLIETRIVQKTGSEWINYSKSTYDYVAGKFVGGKNMVWNNDVSLWYAMDSFVQLYNVNDNIIKKERFMRRTFDVWVPSAKVIYYYDMPASIREQSSTLITKAFLYPNPVTSSNLYFDFFAQKAAETQIVVSNLLGQELSKTIEKGSIGDHSVLIPVERLERGMFFVNIYSEGVLLESLKLVKQ